MNIGIIGAGIMGRGIAETCAVYGLNVVLIDTSDSILQTSRNSIIESLHMRTLFGLPVVDVESVIGRISLNVGLEHLADTDFIIENITEDRQEKKLVYNKISKTCREDVVFAANTSAIPITEIGSWTNRPQQTLGIHFMNPVPVKSSVELIKGYHTSTTSLDDARNFLFSIGKKVIDVIDAPGFVSNRVLMLAVNEAIFLVQEGVASASDADRVFVECFGHPMGLLETADLIGLDTILLSIQALYESFNDSKYRPCQLLKKMVAAGLLGKKSGQGFYNYE
ncbi:3-hydroxyacyl-CoA dehydrogenase family protein [Samsonia erythrinae]|uniref:3-hydroxybutyryl-CoA dehydrogenase n=1 Tax=Samsonia erythrinae TaxID=160434 RepID=A0A4R3VRU6_9GAMM|nr:3-hydroxyacyl-CoA dehydrogenase NAD-binding domain-containing protein [Samsonia erythrinae]TCV06341.1 3-hydroxybutyryl-CoA dehydrogenase [Samsonia erythrinae]